MTQNQSKVLKVYIVRHGQTDYNIKRLIQGHYNSSLNDSGRSQAVILGKYLRSNTDIRFDAVFSSDLQRCITTTNLILSQLGYLGDFDPDQNKPLQEPDSNAHQYKIPVTYTSCLRERCLGPLEQMLFKDAHAKAAAEGKTLMDYGESMSSVKNRLRFIWTQIISQAQANNWSSVLLVSHGGAISKLCADFINTKAARISDSIPVESIAVPPNTSVTTLEFPLSSTTVKEITEDYNPDVSYPKPSELTGQGLMLSFGSTVHLDGPVTTYQDEQ